MILFLYLGFPVNRRSTRTFLLSFLTQRYGQLSQSDTQIVHENKRRYEISGQNWQMAYEGRFLKPVCLLLYHFIPSVFGVQCTHDRTSMKIAHQIS